MTMVSTGEISIGGNATSGGLNRSINIELGRAASATSSLNESALRTLAGVPSGAISLSNFYGKSNRTFSLAGMTGMYGSNVQFAAGNTYCYYTFYTDGDLLGFASPSGSAAVNTDWTLPISAGIGSSYWVRWTIVSSSISAPFSQVGTSGTWQQLSTARTFGLQSGNNNTTGVSQIQSYFQIASDSSGTNIVAGSSTFFLDIEIY
jgi:hypothetical protein